MIQNYNGVIFDDSELARMLLKRNREQSAIFCSPDAKEARAFYRFLHPTEILWFKCMDGRLNGSIITKTPLGIINPIRNLAGSFDNGWPYLQEILENWVDYAMHNRRRCLIFITYHWSKSKKEHGCRGHNYDREAAYRDAMRLKNLIEYVFGYNHPVVNPIVVGIETDEDALLFHGENGNTTNMADMVGASESDLMNVITTSYPKMHSQIQVDLLPSFVGNTHHIDSLRKYPRPVEDTKHSEVALAIGRGFDWLHWLNKVLIIGPYSYDLRTPIKTAAGILLHNLQSGAISKEEGVLLMTSGTYREIGRKARAADLKARSLAKFAVTVIEDDVPELVPYLHYLVGTVDLNTRLYTPSDLTFDPSQGPLPGLSNGN